MEIWNSRSQTNPWHHENKIPELIIIWHMLSLGDLLPSFFLLSLSVKNRCFPKYKEMLLSLLHKTTWSSNYHVYMILCNAELQLYAKRFVWKRSWGNKSQNTFPVSVQFNDWTHIFISTFHIWMSGYFEGILFQGRLILIVIWLERILSPDWPNFSS